MTPEQFEKLTSNDSEVRHMAEFLLGLQVVFNIDSGEDEVVPF